MTTDDYVIWSHEHSAWWKPRRCGYTKNLFYAGIYTREAAMKIVDEATYDWSKAPNEVPVAVVDLPEDAQRLLDTETPGKHKTRYSDSSLYDEVCELCGATDAPADNRLNKPCPGRR